MWKEGKAHESKSPTLKCLTEKVQQSTMQGYPQGRKPPWKDTTREGYLQQKINSGVNCI
jgi:hypothetical protein